MNVDDILNQSRISTGTSGSSAGSSLSSHASSTLSHEGKYPAGGRLSRLKPWSSKRAHKRDENKIGTQVVQNLRALTISAHNIKTSGSRQFDEKYFKSAPVQWTQNTSTAQTQTHDTNRVPLQMSQSTTVGEVVNALSKGANIGKYKRPSWPRPGTSYKLSSSAATWIIQKYALVGPTENPVFDRTLARAPAPHESTAVALPLCGSLKVLVYIPNKLTYQTAAAGNAMQPLAPQAYWQHRREIVAPGDKSQLPAGWRGVLNIISGEYVLYQSWTSYKENLWPVYKLVQKGTELDEVHVSIFPP